MSCLLPQFKCPPDTFFTHFRTQLPKSKEHIYLLTTQCNISTVSIPRATVARAAVLNMEKLQFMPLEANHSNSAEENVTWSSSATSVLDLENLKLPSLESHSNSDSSDRPWTYLSPKLPHTKEKSAENLPKENTLTSEEAVIAAASAEAIALAKAALNLAKNAATKVNHQSEIKTTNFQTESDDDEEPTSGDLEILDEEICSNIAVRSRRQTERKERRLRAAKKAADSVVSVRSGSTAGRRKRAVQEPDYSDPLRYLRGTTNTSRLLTAKEEYELSAGIQDLLKLEKLHEELKKRGEGEPSLMQWASAAGVDQKTFRDRLNYGVLCKERMIKSNIRLVVSIAKNYQGVGMNLQDLVQEGCRGLIKGAEKFDASKGFKFSTYAHWWIKQSVRKSLSDQARIIRLPFHMVEATYKVKEARNRLIRKNKRDPNEEEIALETGLSLKRVMAVNLAPKSPISLDQKTNFEVKLSEVTADPDAETSEDLLMKKLMKEDLEKVLNSLNPRERQVVRWRFGFEDGRMKTLQEIGEIMGVTRERIRQIESCAFRKLKNKKRTKNLHQYLLP